MKRIGIFLFDEVEVLDFAGPFEVFSTASRIYDRQPGRGQEKLFRVVTIAAGEQIVHARGGLQVQANCSIRNHPSLDLVIVPGGIVDAELVKKEVLAWIAGVAQQAEIVASVCTGAFILAEAGLLAGKVVTTHWEDIAGLRKRYPECNVREDKRWIDTGKFVTSAGISAGIDMSLHLVRRLIGHDWATRTARQMQYTWDDQQ